MAKGRIFRWPGACRCFVLAAGIAALAGCGLFEGPYDIREEPPPEGTRAVSLLPEEGAVGPMDDFLLSRLTLDAAKDYAGRKYDGGTTLTIARFSSVEVAASVTEREYDESSAGRRTRSRIGNYSWMQLRGDGRYRFAWTNHEWLFLVEAPSQSAARPVILATGFASEPEPEP